MRNRDLDEALLVSSDPHVLHKMIKHFLEGQYQYEHPGHGACAASVHGGLACPDIARTYDGVPGGNSKRREVTATCCHTQRRNA